MNLRKEKFSRELWMANLSIEKHHCHLHESKYHVFSASASEWVKKTQKSHFYCLLNVQEVEAMPKKLICTVRPHFELKIVKKLKNKPFGLDSFPTSGHRITSWFPLVQMTNKDYWDLIKDQHDDERPRIRDILHEIGIVMRWNGRAQAEVVWEDKDGKGSIFKLKMDWLQWQLIWWKGDEFAQAYMDAAMTRTSERWHWLHIKNKTNHLISLFWWLDTMLTKYSLPSYYILLLLLGHHS